MVGRFTVDTQLFRQLGELLVGRDSTALAELIKNAYDADATEVTVYAEHLDTPDQGEIVISDDGHGMNAKEFERGFLRIASRSKTEGPRVSRRFHRRFTGAKGVGRLAAHKLAKHLTVDTIGRSGKGERSKQSVNATIDWDIVESVETLDQTESVDAISVNSQLVGKTAKTGTLITLRRLRRRWTDSIRETFIQEVGSYEPPQVLQGVLPKAVINEKILFDEPHVRDAGPDTPGFRVILEGDFEGGEQYWLSVAQAANWVIEIDALSETNSIHFAVAPTVRTVNDEPAAETLTAIADHPSPQTGPFFQARILVREGPWDNEIRNWIRGAAGVRVFLEGFRVLPYGEPGSDWLRLNEDYVRRRRGVGSEGLLPGLETDDDVDPADAGLSVLPNTNYVGAVFLTERHSNTLETLISREGFVAGEAYDSLVSIVKQGINLSLRARARTTIPTRRERRQQRASRSSTVSAVVPLRSAVDEAVILLQESIELVKGTSPGDSERPLLAAAQKLESAQTAMANLISEQALLRVLASVGTQMAAFVHEIHLLLNQVGSIESAFGTLMSDSRSPHLPNRTANLVQQSLRDLRLGLERQASFLLDIVRPDARRRRSPQRLAQKFDASASLVSITADRENILIMNNIPKDLRTPSMFGVEIIAIFSNLLTNAVKATEPGGQISVRGERTDNGGVKILIENTGNAVDLQVAEQWFKPFESTTAKVDPILGQGMGLGLPITRSLLDDYGASIHFVSPSEGFVTAIEIQFPGTR